jgi:hypothetical protein
MTSWTIATTEKKSCEEREIWTKGDQEIIVINGFRWGSYSVETSDDNPPDGITAENSEGIDMNALYGDNIENSELISMDDGWYGDIEYSDNITEEAQELIQEGIDEEGDHYSYLENNGWTNDDTEAWFFGPLEITKED